MAGHDTAGGMGCATFLPIDLRSVAGFPILPVSGNPVRHYY